MCGGEVGKGVISCGSKERVKQIRKKLVKGGEVTVEVKGEEEGNLGEQGKKSNKGEGKNDLINVLILKNLIIM